MVWGLTKTKNFVILNHCLMQDSRSNKVRKQGRVLESLPSLKFRVLLDDGQEIIAYLAGKLRIFRIKVLQGDRVTVEMSPYDKERGRIVYRGK